MSSGCFPGQQIGKLPVRYPPPSRSFGFTPPAPFSVTRSKPLDRGAARAGEEIAGDLLECVGLGNGPQHDIAVRLRHLDEDRPGEHSSRCKRPACFTQILDSPWQLSTAYRPFSGLIVPPKTSHRSTGQTCRRFRDFRNASDPSRNAFCTLSRSLDTVIRLY